MALRHAKGHPKYFGADTIVRPEDVKTVENNLDGLFTAERRQVEGDKTVTLGLIR